MKKKILIYEYFTGGGLINEDLNSELFPEAIKMLNYIVNEYKKSENFDIKYFVDIRLKGNDKDSIAIKHHDELFDNNILKKFDLILPILPEIDSKLLMYAKYLKSNAHITILSDIKTIEITSDKYMFYHFCKEKDIPVIETYLSNEIYKIKSNLIVEKDRFGAGCSHVKIISKGSSITSSSYIFQPYIDGDHYSLCVFFYNDRYKLLTVNKQMINIDKQKQVHLCKLIVNQKNHNQFSLHKVIDCINNALPGLYGYVGIDLIISNGRFILTEINPRLTTSFTGISESVGVNIADYEYLASKVLYNSKKSHLYL